MGARARNRHAYVLRDASGVMPPIGWARKAVGLWREFRPHGVTSITAEVNQGGDMVEHTIRAVRRSVPFRAVRATRAKLIRAEPIAALYERGRIFHVGEFAQLEDMMCAFTTGFDRKAAGYSPDRVDALVWALTDLFPDLATRPEPDDDEDDDAWTSRNATTGY